MRSGVTTTMPAPARRAFSQCLLTREPRAKSEAYGKVTVDSDIPYLDRLTTI